MRRQRARLAATSTACNTRGEQVERCTAQLPVEAPRGDFETEACKGNVVRGHWQSGLSLATGSCGENRGGRQSPSLASYANWKWPWYSQKVAEPGRQNRCRWVTPVKATRTDADAGLWQQCSALRTALNKLHVRVADSTRPGAESRSPNVAPAAAALGRTTVLAADAEDGHG